MNNKYERVMKTMTLHLLRRLWMAILNTITPFISYRFVEAFQNSRTANSDSFISSIFGGQQLVEGFLEDLI